MRKNLILAAVALALTAAGGAVLWLMSAPGETPREITSMNTGRILYYQDPSGAPDYSPLPKKNAQGRDFVAVRAAGEPAQQAQRQIKYYRNPMGLADTSPTPKKDSMGMDYIPVYADETDEPGTVKISLDKVQRLGVRTAIAERHVLNERVQLSGTVTADERRQSVVSLKFKAWIAKLHVAATGEKVRAGQPLFDIHSPFILQQETTLALALGAKEISKELGDVYARTNARSESSAYQRLRLYEVPDAEIARLVRTHKPSGHITWVAPHSGTVLEKAAVEGLHAEEGTVLYRIADLSSIWVIAEAPELSLGIARRGASARITLNAYPGQTFEGKVTFVYPEVSMTTRTAKLRIELANHDGLLLPGMFASVDVSAPAGSPVLTVPDSALIDSGARQIVLIARGDGLFEPRAVKAGRRANGMVEVISGLKQGETVVTSATFLIDSESNLRAALQGFKQ
ncbi:MAG: efflux RND transporter periplasmic adaptor subunit [Alphaproteobacteria bacterium]|nr:efflux RND transporter periplasmic adaptor subunit [Alphaproteobacteria bacterium]